MATIASLDRWPAVKSVQTGSTFAVCDSKRTWIGWKRRILFAAFALHQERRKCYERWSY